MEKSLDEMLIHCIRCGFCLEACPTFVVTGSELESPRGRIYLVRSASEGKLRWKEDVKEHLDLCLGCRACETACPSGVEYGAILELARDKIESESPSISKKMLLESTTHKGVLGAQLALGKFLPGKRLPVALSKLISGEAPEADIPSPQRFPKMCALDEAGLPPVKGEVYFLEGCAMSVLFQRVNTCSKRLLRRAGFRVREVKQGCCGALHAHNGHLREATDLGTTLIRAMRDPLPVVVNSAGCGSTMKDYRNLLEGINGSVEFSARVFDLAEFLDLQGFENELVRSSGIDRVATYHEACHLVHGQKISSAPKRLIAAIPRLRVAELEEADMCCGSAGIYNITEPSMARTLLNRKWMNIESSTASLVVTGNPGCHSWISQAGREHGEKILTLHIAEILEASFVGFDALGVVEPALERVTPQARGVEKAKQ